MLLKSLLRALLLAVAMAAPSLAEAQSASEIPVPHMSEEAVADQLRQATTPIYATPPTFTLTPHAPGAHRGKVWVVSTDSGLHVWVKVEAGEQGFHWPEGKSEMLASDHVEVWLAAAPDVEMQPIGWGNQFGQTTLASAKDCNASPNENDSTAAEDAAYCMRWYGRQTQYRQYLRRLFVRQWLVAGEGLPECCAPRAVHGFEDFAATAWAALNADLFQVDMPAELQPKAVDGFTAEGIDDMRQETRKDAVGPDAPRNVRTGYSFHLFLPYTAFPPAQQFDLKDLYFAVDVFSAAPAGRRMGDYATTAPGREWGKPATFNHLQLAAPRTFEVTPCDEKPEQTDLYDQKFASWYFPGAAGKDGQLTSTFALINPAGGYMYQPMSVSPEVVPAHYFSRTLADGATVCGPDLAWRKGKTVRHTEFAIDEKSLQNHALPDGWTLLRSGPTTRTQSAFGSGECGSCLIMDLDIFAVSPHGDVSPALRLDQSLSGEGDNPQGADLTFSPDWKRVTVFLNSEDYNEKDPKPEWTSVTYCLDGHAYAKCEESKQATPPDPPHFPEISGPQ